MKVLHLTRDYPPRHGGGMSTAVAGMVLALQEHGIESTIVSFDDWRPRRGGPETPTLEDQSGRVLRVRGAERLSSPVIQDLGFKAFDLIHIHDAIVWLHHSDLRKQLGLPAVYTAHMCHKMMARLRGPNQGPDSLSISAEAQALDEADLVFAPSPAALQALATDYQGAVSRLRLTPFALTGAPLPDAQRSNAHPPDTPQPSEARVLYAGRFGDLKGTADLLEAVPGVLARQPNTRFTIAGGLPYNPKATSRWTRKFAAAGPSVQATGWLTTKELQTQLARSYLFVAPSHFETFGLTTLEAMAAGLPIVACRAGGSDSFLVDGVNCLLVDPGRPDQLGQAILTLLEDPKYAQGLAQAAQVSAAEWTWSRQVQHLTAAYREVSDD